MRKTVATLFATALLAGVGAAPAAADVIVVSGPSGGGSHTGDGGFCWC